jgi:hypothetical protein
MNLSTTASGNDSHAEGHMSIAEGHVSHAEGEQTKASSKYQHVQGCLNIIDTTGSQTTKGTYAHILGNGNDAYGTRSNAHTIKWNGEA